MLEFIPLFIVKRLGMRYVAEVNGIDSEQKRLYGMAEWKIRLSEWLHGMCYNLADAIVTVTDEIREYLSRRYPKTKEKTYVVSNGANIEVSRPIKKPAADIRTWKTWNTCRNYGFQLLAPGFENF